jgi:Leucine-rich repeat (LRR) protein
MHDVALSAMENEVATITDEKPKQSEFLQNTCRHIFLSCDEPEDILNGSLKTRSPAIQTLLCGRIKSSLHHVEKYSSMRALLFSPSKGTFLLKPKYLRHLRYLDVSCSDIESLPKDISILYHLHTLDVSHCFYLARLPKEIKYMTALRHLYTHGCGKLKGMPPKLGQLTSLQTLTNFVVGVGSDCSSIGELQHLNNLSGSLLLIQLENVTEAIDAKMAHLGSKKELTALSLRWTATEEEKPHCLKVLEGLEAPHGLKALKINDYTGTSFPAWMNKLPNMVELHLKGCKKLKNLPPLWQVPALQVLCLKGFENLQCLCSGDKFFNFPNLKELMLVGLPAFDRWCEVKSLQREQVIFPHLEKLSIEKCEKLTALPEAAAASGQSCSQNHTEIRSAFPALKVLRLKISREI